MPGKEQTFTVVVFGFLQSLCEISPGSSFSLRVRFYGGYGVSPRLAGLFFEERGQIFKGRRFAYYQIPAVGYSAHTIGEILACMAGLTARPEIADLYSASVRDGDTPWYASQSDSA